MSTIPAVLAALASLGASTLTSAQVVNGDLGNVTVTSNRLLLVGDDEIQITRDLDSLSATTTSEQYEVPCTLSADVAGTDQTVADAMVFADYAALELAVREYAGGPDLGLRAQGVFSVLPLGIHSLRRMGDGDGRHAAVRFRFRVYAQNT